MLTPYRVGDYVGVEGPRDARDAVPLLNQSSRTNITGNPPMTQLVVSKQYVQSVAQGVLTMVGVYNELVGGDEE